MAWLRAMAPTVIHPYIVTGLSFVDCTHVDGGYYIDNGTLHLDMTIKFNSSQNTNNYYSIVTGFAHPASDTYVSQTGSSDLTITFINTSGELRVYPRKYSANQEVRFTGSYSI